MLKNEGKTSNLLIPGAILLGFVIVLAGMIWALNAFSFRVATVDLNKIAKESSSGQKFYKDLQKKEEQLRPQAAAAKTPAERNKIQNEFTQFQEAQQNAFLDRVKAATAQVAKAKGIKAVSSPQVFIYSSMDITGDVITKLDK